MGSGDLAAESLVPPKGKPGARGTPRFQYFKGEIPSESEKGRTRRSEGFGDKALSVKRPETNRQLNHCSSRKKGQPLHLVSHFRSWGTWRCWHLEKRPMETEWQERGTPLSAPQRLLLQHPSAVAHVSKADFLISHQVLSSGVLGSCGSQGALVLPTSR